MKESNIYQPLWSKYRPAIVQLMKSAAEVPQEYQLSKYEFETIGDRGSSGYSFNLEISNGHVVNNISGSAVARDLYSVLGSSPSAKKLMENRYYRINLTTVFILKIQILS